MHFDNKFWKGVKNLLLKQGALSHDFETGRKAPYLKPVQLFIICNLLFFFIVGQSNVFAVKLFNYQNFQHYTRSVFMVALCILCLAYYRV